jgi:hypothetical protein
MRGISFVVDNKGRRIAVQIDLKKYGALLEDFFDGIVSESRRSEKSIPYEDFAKRLRDRRKPEREYRGPSKSRSFAG